MALSRQDVEALADLATSRNLALGVLFQLRGTWPAVAARDVVRGGTSVGWCRSGSGR